MSERSPTPEKRRYTDEELIEMSLTSFNHAETYIDDATARMISSQFHGGQASDLYSFSSTGYIADGLFNEISRAFEEFKEMPAEQRKLAALAVYVAERRSRKDRAAREGWSNLWLEQPPKSDACPCCAEHISNPHGYGCPLGTDDEELLDRICELQDEHGTPMMHWLNYLGCANTEQVEAAAASFNDHFYGHYPSIEVFRQSYDIGPDEYIDQTYLIVEEVYGDGVYVYDR